MLSGMSQVARLLLLIFGLASLALAPGRAAGQGGEGPVWGEDGAGVPPVGARGPMRLRLGYAAGFAYREKIYISHAASITLRSSYKTETLPYYEEVSIERVVRIEAADPGGRPTRMRLEFARARRSSGTPPVETTLPIEGFAFVIERTAAGVSVLALTPSGTFDPGEEVRTMLEPELRSIETEALYLPPVDAFVGDRWIAPQRLVANLYPQAYIDRSYVRGRLVGVVDREGRRSARLRVEVAAAVPDGPLTREVRGAGDLHYDFARRAILALDLEGPLTITGEATAPGTDVAVLFSGDGRFMQRTVRTPIP
jgi:hypothetical protein